QSLILVAEDPERLAESRMRLARVGVEKVAGYLDGGILAWERAGMPLAQMAQISVLDLREQMNGASERLQVVDVRRPAEWDAGHIEGAELKPLDGLRGMLADLDPGNPVAVHCQSGFRSSIAASLLARAGFRDVRNVVGGFDAWAAQKLPVPQAPQPSPPAASRR